MAVGSMARIYRGPSDELYRCLESQEADPTKWTAQAAMYMYFSGNFCPKVPELAPVTLVLGRY
jgi:hypothetical protein